MSPRSLRYLLAVAEHKSFTRAADVLYVSQPTLSQQIKQLEESLNVQLLDRSGRTVRLTDAGEIYAQHARRALRELDAAQREIHDLQDLSRGSLRVAMTPITDYLATPLLEVFAERYPGIGLHIHEMSQELIEVALAAGEVDVGIAFSDTLSSEARSEDIEKHELFAESLRLVVGKAHTLARQKASLGARILEQQPLALLSNNFALRRHIDAYCGAHDIVPHIGMETNSVGVIVELVRRGRLATVLPHGLAVAQSGLRALTLTPEVPPHTVTLMCRKGTYKSASCRAFAVLAASWCNEKREAV